MALPRNPKCGPEVRTPIPRTIPAWKDALEGWLRYRARLEQVEDDYLNGAWIAGQIKRCNMAIEELRRNPPHRWKGKTLNITIDIQVED